MRRLKALTLAALSTGAILLPAGTANAATTTVCAGNVPGGWVKTNDTWDPTRCGNPTSISYNVWTIESTFDKPVGWTMWACAGWKPSGWGIVNTTWDPTRCGHPTSITANIWVIRRFF